MTEEHFSEKKKEEIFETTCCRYIPIIKPETYSSKTTVCKNNKEKIWSFIMQKKPPQNQGPYEGNKSYYQTFT